MSGGTWDESKLDGIFGFMAYNPEGETTNVIQIEKPISGGPWSVWLWDNTALRWDRHVLHPDTVIEEVKAWSIATWRMS